MSPAKYIVYDLDYPRMVIFDGAIEHGQMASDLNVVPYIVSAGFIAIDLINGEAKCYGKSVGLQVGVGQEDNELANKLLGLI
jgi:hypothetical protein